MRYYSCLVRSNSDDIQKNAKVRLKDYDYDNTIAAVNKYMYMKLPSSVRFFMYCEDGSKIKAAFSFQEEKISYREVVATIGDGLIDVADIRLDRSEPEDITILDYVTCILEARRRGVLCHSNLNYLNDTNEFIYTCYNNNEYDARHMGFTFEEKVVSLGDKKCNCMYDDSLLNEVKNIENHKNKTKMEGNMVHYIISAKSREAACDMTETIMRSLIKANRISSRRIEMVSNMHIDLFRLNNYLEKLIEGNKGGAIVIDLCEKLGTNPVDYALNCEYIEKLVRKYKNDCLFVFNYNIDHPGFAYKLVPMVQKYVSFVKINEATGDRKAAVAYLKGLIKESEYSKFANQAEEFLESYRGDKFSQTEILEAYEKFEPWCMNRNFFGAYEYNPDEDFLLARDKDTVSPYEKLEQLIGLSAVKKQISNIIAAESVEKERKERFDKDYPTRCMHMVFKGNPGTAKTTVAKLFAGIAKEKGILKSGIFVERGGMDYNGLGYIKIRRDFEAAKGGVLFIDEAYALTSDMAVSILIQEMENHRDEVIVIFAGYSDRLQEFISINDGMKSRIPYWVDFPDYSVDELVSIFKLAADERKFNVDDDAIMKASQIFDKARFMDNFGNGRYARNLFEDAIQNQSVRLLETYGDTEKIPENEMFHITCVDLETSEEDKNIIKVPGTARQELDDMIGLTNVKQVISKAVAYFKLKKLYNEKGISKERASMHMVFTGNPGTAKTSTARLLAEILRDEKILPSGKFVEVGRADLVGTHVGQTAPLVKQRFKEAQGGVLFIDEAYSLCDGVHNGFGDEAISTIVQEMENHREDVIVIFAGYPKEMEEFLEKNPGMASRIAFRVEFDDYSTDELCDIAKLMLSKKQLVLTDDAIDKLRVLFEEARKSSDYGNGRFVRNVLEEAEMNLAERVSKFDVDNISIDKLTTIEACDIGECKKTTQTTVKIGFAV